MSSKVIFLLFLFPWIVLSSQQDQVKITVVIDVFRAFTTASYVLEHCPAAYILATKGSAISRLAKDPYLLIGKPEKCSDLIYDIPNSPTRVLGVEVANRKIFHRTEAGAKGILMAKDADLVLAAGFVNADATVHYIKTFNNPVIKIVPMGHEGNSPSLEDDLCGMYIEALLSGNKFDITPFLSFLREGSGSYFFGEDQWQYPREDFERCLEIDRFNFAIQAELKEDYALLYRKDFPTMMSVLESEAALQGNL